MIEMNAIAVVVVNKDTTLDVVQLMSEIRLSSSNDLIHSVVFEQQYGLVGCREN